MIIVSAGYKVPANLIIYAAAAGFFLALYLFRWLRWKLAAARALSWPSAEAVIESSYELDVSSRYTEKWVTVLQYSYEVNGQFYSGSYCLPEPTASPDMSSSQAKDWLHKKIIVRYHPSKPEKSVFLEKDGAPGSPYIPVNVREGPGFTTLSLK